MRRVTLVAALALIAAPAFAQTTTTAPKAAPAPVAAPVSPAPTSAAPTTAPTAVAPTTTTSTTTTTTTKKSRRISLDERFVNANTTHDGHLTKAQAEAAGNMKNTVRHFDAIDTDKKGYVTLEEIHAYNRAKRAAHKAAKKQAN